MFTVIQGSVIPSNISTYDRSISSSNPGSIKGPEPVELIGIGSPNKSNLSSFRGAAPPSRLVSPAVQYDQGYPFLAVNQVPTVISSAPALAPRVTLPVREVPVSSFPSPPSSSPLLTTANLPVSAGFTTVAPAYASGQVGATVATSVFPPEHQLRVLFEATDSNRDGYLEWNTGDVEAFGKAVLDRYGRDSNGSQVLLYNVYDETDRNIDAKMDVFEGMQFARKILEKSNPFKPVVAQTLVPPSTATSLFDTKASSTLSAFDTYPNFVQREPYVGPVYSTGQLQPQDGRQNGTASQSLHSSDSMEFQRLERENARLAEDNRMMQNRLYDLEKELVGQDLSVELARTQSENERLKKIARELELRLEAKTKEQVSSFDPVATDQRATQLQQRANELEEQNYILRAQLESAKEHVSSDQHRESEIARELHQVLQDNDRLANENRMLQDQLAISMASGGGQGSFVGATLDVETLQERERMMSKEIDELMLENSELKIRLESQAGVPTAETTKKKKFLCC